MRGLKGHLADKLVARLLLQLVLRKLLLLRFLWLFGMFCPNCM